MRLVKSSPSPRSALPSDRRGHFVPRPLGRARKRVPCGVRRPVHDRRCRSIARCEHDEHRFTDYRLEAPSGFREPVLSIGRFDLGVGTRSLLDDTKEIAISSSRTSS